MEAQDDIRRWYYTLEEPHRTPQNLQDKALETAKHALEALGHARHGGRPDALRRIRRCRWRMRVARAAREGDMFGIGGELDQRRSERSFIERLDQIVQERRTIR